MSSCRARTTLRIAASIATIRTAVGTVLCLSSDLVVQTAASLPIGQIWAIPSKPTRNHRFVLPRTGYGDPAPTRTRAHAYGPPRQDAALLQLNLGPRLFELGLDLFSLVFADAFL